MTDPFQSLDLRSQLRGLWLPLVTPFCDGVVDQASLKRLVRHYASLPIGGLILAVAAAIGISTAGVRRGDAKSYPASPGSSALGGSGRNPRVL